METERPWLRLSLLWAWCIFVSSPVWLNPFTASLNIETILPIAWFSGPILCLILSVVLALWMPTLLWAVRLFAAAYLGLAIVASITATTIFRTAELVFGVVLLSVLGIVGVMLPIVLLSPRTTLDPPTLLRGRIALVASAAVSTLGLFAWSLANIPIVELQARQLAHGRPYCIAVSDHYMGYRTVEAHSQFAALSMYAPFVNGGGSDDYQFTYHALMRVDGGLYNWSFTAMRFTPAVGVGVLDNPDCQPQIAFIEGLRLF